MWHTILEWCGPVALLIALVAYLFPQVGASVGNSILNWWATRSRSTTEKRIEKLEKILEESEPLPLLTDFEEMVIRGLTGITVLLMMMPALAALAYITVFSPAPLFRLTVRDLYQQTLLTLILLIGALMGVGIQRVLDRFRLNRNLEYRQSLRKQIEQLRARLT